MATLGLDELFGQPRALCIARRCTLPDFYPVTLRSPHRITPFDAKCCKEFWHIRQWPYHAELGGRVLVAAHLVRDGLGPFIDHPCEGIAKEEALVGIKPSNDLMALVLAFDDAVRPPGGADREQSRSLIRSGRECDGAGLCSWDS